MGIQKSLLCSVLEVSTFLHSYIAIPTLQEIIFRGEAFGKWLGYEVELLAIN